MSKMYNRKWVFWSACVGMLLFGIGLITLGSVAGDLKAKFNLDDISSGTLFSILPFGILIGSLLFGPICDKYGYKLLLSVSCILMFLGFEGIAFAPNPGLLRICIFFFGLGAGAINGATNAVVSDISETNKGASLSVLGIFFGIGALGVPVVSGLLKGRVGFEVILASIGFITLIAGIFYMLIRFPEAKHQQGFPLRQSLSLFRDRFIVLIAFFLFFQSSFEAIINNWTTLFLLKRLPVSASDALYALSFFVVGITLMRIIIGSVLRKTGGLKILFGSFCLTLTGLLFLKSGTSLGFAMTGLLFVGAGLSGGFPIMLGFVGNRYRDLSGTAFSFVLVIALLGNMLVNYGMGYIAQYFGILHVVDVALIELAAMIVLCIFIHKSYKI
jgi:MFS family permease